MLPSNDQIELGYLRDGARFITLETLNCPGLQVWRDGEALEVSLAGKTMHFTIDLDE